MAQFWRAFAWLILLGFMLSRSGSVLAQPSEDQQTAEARRLYNEAKRAFKDEKFREAALSFEAASKLRAHAVALYTAAQAWELAGEPDRAADDYARALSTPKLEDEQSARARQRLEKLEPDLGIVAVVGHEDTRVQLDNHMEMTLPARLHGVPGDHILTVQRAKGAVERRAITLTKEKPLEIDAEASEAAAPEPAPAAQPVQFSEPRKVPIRVEQAPRPVLLTVGWVATGAGVAALGGAVLLGLSANDAEDTFKAAPTRETYDHAKGLQTKTNVMLVTGGVLTVLGVGLVVWQSSKSAERAHIDAARVAVHASPAGLWLEGRY